MEGVPDSAGELHDTRGKPARRQLVPGSRQGGGILFGDVCHFIDLAIWFQRSLPREVHALATKNPGHREES